MNCGRCGSPHTPHGDIYCADCEADWRADRVDDGVKSCPDCERPNQFGELCASCERERQALAEWSARYGNAR